MSLLLVGIGLAVALTFFVGPPASEAGAAGNPQKVSQKSEGRPQSAVVSPEVDNSLEKKAPKVERPAKREVAPGPPAAQGPEDESLKVTVPALSRIENAKVPYADGANEAAFKRYVGVHLQGTGHPWDEEANVYIAGHRFGYPGTDSFLAFWDLNQMKTGDSIILTDADGKRYVYKVFKKFVVEPTRVSVTRPLEGRNIVTLQTCTLPDYSDRLIVQAEKVA